MIYGRIEWQIKPTESHHEELGRSDIGRSSYTSSTSEDEIGRHKLCGLLSSLHHCTTDHIHHYAIYTINYHNSVQVNLHSVKGVWPVMQGWLHIANNLTGNLFPYSCTLLESTQHQVHGGFPQVQSVSCDLQLQLAALLNYYYQYRTEGVYTNLFQTV